MKKSSGPVREFPLAEQALRDFKQFRKENLPDFSNVENTFSHLSTSQLRGSRRLFQLMGVPWLTALMGSLGMKAVNLGLPGAKWMVQNTIYKQFVGGTSLLAAHDAIERLATRGVTSILDYGAEGSDDREGMDNAMKEAIKAIEFSATTDAAIGAVVKVSGLIAPRLLTRLNDEEIDFSAAIDSDLKTGLKRLDAICTRARALNCEIYLDAEESWMQRTVDHLAELMMERYNTERHIVFTTCQMYRHDRLEYLRAAHQRAVRGNYKLSVKLVRGAYMVKERNRAEKMGYEDPIQPSIEATHRDFNAAVSYCLDHLDGLACTIATHNEASTMLAVQTLADRNIRRDHPNLHFCQLLGMSDNLTFNLAEGGYNVSKYMVYGPVAEVLPYLVRRAQENTSVTGEASRELKLLERELARRDGR